MMDAGPLLMLIGGGWFLLNTLTTTPPKLKKFQKRPAGFSDYAVPIVAIGVGWLIYHSQQQFQAPQLNFYSAQRFPLPGVTR